MESLLSPFLGPMFRSIVLASSVLVSVPSAMLTWFVWTKTRKRTILGIALLFTGWAASATFFAIRYGFGATDFSDRWFVVANAASIAMSVGAVIYLWSLLRGHAA